MSRVLVGLMLAAACALAMSCKSESGSNEPTAAQPDRSKRDAASAAPGDAQWTILCVTLSGPGHVERAKALKDQLTRDTPLREWYLVHRENETDLCHGYYRAFEAGQPDGDRAQRDRRTIDGIRDQVGERPFAYAIFVPLTTADPPAPGDWDLRRADGVWTIEIASYAGHPQRKQYAIDAVRDARARGIEAYFYHGPSASSVCIGSWPAQAVEEVQLGSSDPRGPDEVIVVVPQGTRVPDDFVDEQGRRVRHVQQSLRIVDPAMAAVMRQYPDHPVNGSLMLTRRRDPQTGRMTETTDKSFVVRIPTADEAEPSPDALDETAVQDTLLSPAPPPDVPGAGRLRRYGE